MKRKMKIKDVNYITLLINLVLISALSGMGVLFLLIIRGAMIINSVLISFIYVGLVVLYLCQWLFVVHKNRGLKR